MNAKNVFKIYDFNTSRNDNNNLEHRKNKTKDEINQRINKISSRKINNLSFKNIFKKEISGISLLNKNNASNFLFNSDNKVFENFLAEYETGSTRQSINITYENSPLYSSYRKKYKRFSCKKNKIANKSNSKLFSSKFNSQKKLSLIGKGEVPIEFINSMKFNIKTGLSEANKYFAKEKLKKLEFDPNFKYVLKSKKIKYKTNPKDKLNLANLTNYTHSQNKSGLPSDISYNLYNFYNKKWLLDNKNNFERDIRVIPINKFSEKYQLYENDDNKISIITKSKKIVVVKKNKFKIKNESPKLNLTDIHKRLRNIIKKSAIEFKNIIIPFDQYVYYFYEGRSIKELIYKNDYHKFINIIKSSNINEVLNSLKKDKQPLFIQDFYKRTALIYATKKNLFQLISVMVSLGSNINLGDIEGKTALHHAVINNYLDCVIVLLYELANPMIKDKKGNLPIYYTSFAITENTGIIKELLQRVTCIVKMNKYRSWKEYASSIRKGIEFFLNERFDKNFLKINYKK